jgi:signal transduction histidine kinase/DNA-binding NarL/FixJ family response regulator
LNNFSFEELSSEEAARLQRSFLTFKNQLEDRVWGDEGATSSEVNTGNNDISPVNYDADNDLRRVAAVCRQMRTPLNGIIGLADLLGDSRLSEEQLYHVQSIQASGRELMNVVIELTEYSRLFAGLETFERVPFNFHNLIQDVEYLCNTLIVDKRLRFKVEMDQAIPGKLSGDPSKLSQVLLHLLGTSLKQEREGSISLEVQFQHQEGENVYLEFVISHQGEAKDGKYTESGETYRPSVQAAFRKAGDTGLGLPIVRQIIAKLRGEIFIQETSGQTASYRFRLPFTRAGNNSKTLGNNYSVSTLKGLQILVLENNPLNQRMLERRLRSWGCIPSFAENASYCLQVLDETVDLVLMALQRPEIDGYSIAGKIRTHPNHSLRKVPIIALMDQISDNDKDCLLKLGIDAYIIKPYGAEELQSKLLQLKKPSMGRLEKIPSSMNSIQALLPDDRKINLLPVLEDCLGRMETLEELVLLYKQKALEFIGAVKLLLDRSDYKGITYACQKISASLKLLKTDSLSTLVEQIHKTSRTNQDIRHLRFLHRCFVEEYPLVEAALDSALEQLKKNE